MDLIPITDGQAEKPATVETENQAPKGYVDMTSHSFGNKSKKIVDPRLGVKAPPPSIFDDPNNPNIVVAPTMHGRSFTLRCFHNQTESTGQLLVLMDREHYGAPYEVLETFFPRKSERRGMKRDRFYLGDRKLGKRFLAGIMEIQMTQGKPTKFRMLYPSGKQIHDWKPLDLAKLRLKTTEEQRAHITVFTGVIYKVQEEQARSKKHPSPLINRAIDDKLASELKKHLAKKKD